MSPDPGDHEPRELSEPFPWMSAEKKTGPYRNIAVRTPRQEAFWGVFLLIAAVVSVGLLVGSGDRSLGAVLLGVLLVVIFGGLGVTFLVIARARARWVRAYRDRHGLSPL